ncbi:MAG TPA: MFS transporter [Patescibacteria group bacterium]|nr:MFS transporter [Patescibacteria group bacterium]
MKSPSASQVPSATVPTATTGTNVERISLYHWLVVLLAALGWLFDCMGQRIFVLSREPALRELLGPAAADDVRRWGGLATFLLMFGWATGGIVFGLLSDRYGRVKTMVLTLLSFSVFSAVSGFAHTSYEFLGYRFLFGLGVGGMFGAATTLIAESVPRHFRTMALGSMQAFSACGNMLASALSLKITPGVENFWGHYSGWQVLSFVSVFPALMALPMALILKEPEVWRKAKAEAATGTGTKSVGSLWDLFSDPRWRKNLLVGVCLGVAGMVGLWGIAFFSPELITTAFKDRPLLASEIVRPGEICSSLNAGTGAAVLAIKNKLSPELINRLAQIPSNAQVPADLNGALAPEFNRVMRSGSLYDPSAFQGVNLKKSTRNLIQVSEKKPDPRNLYFLNRQLLEQVFPGAIQELQTTIDQTRSAGTFLQDFGALFGMFAFTLAAAYLSRRTAFLGAFALCLVVVSFVFYSLKTATDVYWMLPLMGFATLSVFAGYSIYFPEIFPTRLRGTGVGFCYNTVRYLAAPFPLLLGWLGTLMPFRQVAIMMCGIYLVGIIALIWAPETKGQPLPE